jgi:hypothetical protein
MVRVIGPKNIGIPRLMGDETLQGVLEQPAQVREFRECSKGGMVRRP